MALITTGASPAFPASGSGRRTRRPCRRRGRPVPASGSRVGDRAGPEPGRAVGRWAKCELPDPLSRAGPRVLPPGETPPVRRRDSPTAAVGRAPGRALAFPTPAVGRLRAERSPSPPRRWAGSGPSTRLPQISLPRRLFAAFSRVGRRPVPGQQRRLDGVIAAFALWGSRIQPDRNHFRAKTAIMVRPAGPARRRPSACRGDGGTAPRCRRRRRGSRRATRRPVHRPARSGTGARPVGRPCAQRLT
jgi:hypothetical protein